MGSYFSILLLTIGLEVAVLAQLVRRPRRLATLSGASLLLTIVAVNLLTHPAATIASGLLAWPVALLEAVVFVTEGLGYYAILGLGWKQATILSFAANAVTALTGWLAFYPGGLVA